MAAFRRSGRGHALASVPIVDLPQSLQGRGFSPEPDANGHATTFAIHDPRFTRSLVPGP